MPYILNTKKDIREMLKAIGINSVDELFSQLPPQLKIKGELNLPAGLSEQETKRAVKKLAGKNKSISCFNSFLGAGCYDHYIPSAVAAVLSRSEFVTAYTPYQAECSQGILQAIYEYQSYICLLTGLEVSNASLLDGASALAEAVLMALRITGRKSVIVSSAIHPEYRNTLRTYLSGFDFTIQEIDFVNSGLVNLNNLRTLLNKDTACFAFSSPNFFGLIEDAQNISSLLGSCAALSVLVSNPLSFAILKSAGSLGVDIACGDGGVFGGNLNYGGPSFGFLATKYQFLRQMPGRIVGKTEDREGRPAYCLTLQAREQHIRREKATSNICSNHSLNAIGAAIYLSLMGKKGIQDVALNSLNLTQHLYQRLHEIPRVEFPFSNCFFNEFVWKIPNAQGVFDALYKDKIIAGVCLEEFYPNLKDCILSCCTEKKSKEDIDIFVKAIKDILSR